MLTYIIDNTSLICSLNESAFNYFRNDCIDDFNNIPHETYNQASFDITAMGNCYHCQFQRKNRISIPAYSDELFDSYALDVSDNTYELVISLSIDARQIDGFNVPVEECLYQSLLDIIQYDEPNFEYASQYIPLFWDICDISSFNFITLSENCISNHESFNWLYNQMISTLPSGWDLIMVHYNQNTELFSNAYNEYTLQEFIQYILQSNSWSPPNNIWLWACDAGIPNNNNYIVAQEMSMITGCAIKAANGRIITARTKQYTPENPDFVYFIVNVNGTKWDLDDYNNMTKIEYMQFKIFLLLHMARTEEAEWNTFIGGEYVA